MKKESPAKDVAAKKNKHPEEAKPDTSIADERKKSTDKKGFPYPDGNTKQFNNQPEFIEPESDFKNKT